MTPWNDPWIEAYQRWDGDAVVTHFDAATGAWFFIALHDRTLGRPTGGTRMKPYPHPAAGLSDAMRLARAMTHKWALAGLPVGGGKAVIALAPDRPLTASERTALLRRYGQELEALGGAFATGQDLGTSPADMALLRAETRWVHGAHGGSPVDPGPFTARGVFSGLRAAVTAVFGSADLTGRRVWVEGLGSVGGPLAEQLAAAGAELVLTDVDSARRDHLAARLGAQAVSRDEALTRPMDVYAPCAVGGTVDGATIERLPCRIVAGGANEQLADPDADAAALHARGILWVPDYALNAGGALGLTWLGQGATVAEILNRCEVVGETVASLLAEASGGRVDVVAERRVKLVLGAGGEGRKGRQAQEGQKGR